MKTITTWTTGQEFESTYRKGTILMDGHHGYSPKALLLAGLSGCAGIDVTEILEKMRVPFGGLRIDAETTQTEGPPKVFQDIHLTFRIKTGEENREKVKKAIDLSLQKYCGVAAMLQKHAPIHYTIDIQPE